MTVSQKSDIEFEERDSVNGNAYHNIVNENHGEAAKVGQP